MDSDVQTGSINGDLRETTNLVGSFTAAGSVNGDLYETTNLAGSITADEALIGQIVIGGGGDPYRGEYRAIPTFEQQTFPTANKQMMQDFTIEEIPYAEVANPSGGMTITIGG